MIDIHNTVNCALIGFFTNCFTLFFFEMDDRKKKYYPFVVQRLCRHKTCIIK